MNHERLARKTTLDNKSSNGKFSVASENTFWGVDNSRSFTGRTAVIDVTGKPVQERSGKEFFPIASQAVGLVFVFVFLFFF